MEHQPLRSTDVRDRNQKLILRLLFQEGPLSQSQVVQRTGLKAPTVFRIFAKLEDETLIRPCEGPDKEDVAGASGVSDRKGRRPVYYCVVPGAVFAIGVDFSTAGVSVIVVNFVNEVIHHLDQEFVPGIRRDEVLSRIRAMIGSAIDECELDPARIAGIGIGSPGRVNTLTGTVVDYARIEGLTGFSIREHFEQMFRVPVFVHNNASVIAASEYRYDAAVDFDSVLAVLVRGGVGAAFVNHGEVFLNGSTTALEIGRTECTAKGSGPGDVCTLEELVGERRLLQLLQDVSQVSDWPAAEAKLSEERLAEILADPVRVFCTSVRNLYHVLHPDAILLISRYAKLARVLAREVAAHIPEAKAIPVPYDPVKACYGATDLVFRQYFSGGTPLVAGQLVAE
jgi:predicted NBD/HSP70 family sugar kinase